MYHSMISGSFATTCSEVGSRSRSDSSTTNEVRNMNRKEALNNIEEALILLREVERAVRDGKLEAGLEFENDFTEAVNEIERIQADLTEYDPEA
jgi:hypothetical protein